MIDERAMITYIYCRQRVQYLGKLPIDKYEDLEAAWKTAYRDSSRKLQRKIADEALITLKKVENNARNIFCK